MVFEDPPEHCLVICGDWHCREDETSDFVINKCRMSRIVVLKPGNKLFELSDRLVTDFGLAEDDHIATLSYWPVNTCGFETGGKTPLVLLTSDGALNFFVSQLRLNKSLTLCVKFITFVKRSANGLSQSSGYTTLATDNKRRCVFSTPVSNTNSNHSVTEKVLRDDYVGLASVGSKTNPILTDDELIEGVEIAEALYAESSGKRKDSESDPDDEKDIFGTESFPEFDLRIDDENDTRPRGYDIDFWGKFINNDYGGSNAVEIMCSPHARVDNNKWMKKKEVLYSSNDAFDHMVVLNGGSSSSGDLPKHEEVKGCFTGSMKTNSPYMGHSSGYHLVDKHMYGQGSASTGQQRLADIDDEEFDIPPLFDDTEYEAEEIHDLDRDESDDHVYVGKVFASKEDCQISLAIFATRKCASLK